jgi:hypothetical protein
MHPANGDDQASVPASVAAFFVAVNSGDLDAIVDSFASGAMVNDELQEYWDRPAITEWASRHVVGQRLALDVRRVVRNGDQTVVAAKVDGIFDKRGLPDPLVLTFYFSSSAGKLVQLLILRNEPALSSAP